MKTAPGRSRLAAQFLAAVLGLVAVTGAAALLALLLGSFGLAGALAAAAALVILLMITAVALCDSRDGDGDGGDGDSRPGSRYG